MDRNFQILLGLINSYFKALSDAGFKIYDADNPEYFISDITYERESDQLIAHFEEEKR